MASGREPAARHIAVTALRHSRNAPVKAGVDSGHGVPVTPDERAPPIRGRVFAKLVTYSYCKPFRPVIIYQSCPKLLSRRMKARVAGPSYFQARRLRAV
jgi:hypothetical protein